MKTTKQIFVVFILVLIISHVQAQHTGLNVGDKVDNFEAKAENGKIWKSKKVIGKKNLVVYFYPAAMTGGCTKQACAYRDAMDDLSSVDAEVVGISGDEVKNLKLFKQAHNLNFTLLSDPDGGIARMFGVPVTEGNKSIEREVEGTIHTLTRGLTTSRWTFIIGKQGKVIYKSTDVNAAEDSKAVLGVLKNQLH
ncbi:MAG: peroxiredoxin [Bacteroidales bacterium]